MTTTTRFDLTSTAYSELADGLANVSLLAISIYPARVHVGTTLPDADTVDFFLVNDQNGVSLGSLAVGDKVYACAEFDEASIVVIAG